MNDLELFAGGWSIMVSDQSPFEPSAGGKDIFSESFALYDDHAEVVDFNQEKYRIDLVTGHSSLVA